MYENMSSLNLLGLNEILATGRVSWGQSTDGNEKTRTSAFADLLASFSENDTQGDVAQFMDKAGITMPAGCSLQQLYLDAMLKTMSTDFSTADTTASTSTATTDTTTTSQSGTTTGTTTSSSRSQQEIVLTVGSENAELLTQINNATSLDERLKYGTAMRDKIVTALRAEGYSVETTGSIDKISINGQVIDVMQNLKTLGMNSRIQYLETQNGGNSNVNNEITTAILEAAQTGINSLLQLRASTDPSQRQQLALTIRTQIVEQLNAKGYNCTGVFGSADKITLNGNTYDFLSGLNSNSSQTHFQALKV